MNPASTSTRFLVLLTVVGIFCSTGIVGTASASLRFTLFLEDSVTGSGSAGSGSLAVASFYSSSASSGAGGFSGTIGGLPVSGLFNLTVSNPASTPNLSCATSGGQVSAAGTVISGSFIGHQVLVAGCVDKFGKVVLVLIDVTPWHCIECAADFAGKGMGIVTLSNMSPKAGVAMAGVTSGLGSAGSGTLYVAEADVATQDGTIFGGGAYTGTISDHAMGNNWVTAKASIQPGCVLTSSGTTASFGTFPNQPLTNTYTLDACPPPNGGPLTAHFGMLMGVGENPIFKSTGSTDSSILELIGA